MPKFLWALTIVAILAVGAYVYVLIADPFATVPEGDGVFCTADAMLCPDGSYVGRTGPNCEFVCPAAPSSNSSTSSSVTVKMGQTVTGLLGVKIRPLSILEDSRCPLDVQCIQAGTVRLRAQMVDGMGTSTNDFMLNAPITGEAVIVTLIDVLPAPKSTVQIEESQYQFVFKIEKRPASL